MPAKFQEKVYREVKKIKKGQTKTYGQIAKAVNSSPRAVGQALKKNTDKSVPCHRVILSSGKSGGYNRGVKKKIRLLRKEGIKI